VAAFTAAGGTAAPKPVDPAKAGYVFTGWFDAETGGTLYSWPHTLTADITMHAQWRGEDEPAPAQYTLTFDSTGGTAVAAITADEGTAVGRPGDPVKAGYVFTGWYSAASGGTEYAWPYTLSADITLYAQWRAHTEPPPVPVNITLWVNEDGSILASGNDVTISKTGGGGSFSATVSGGWSGVQWYLNGFPIPGSRGTAQSISISAADYSTGIYRLGVSVSKGGGLYSRDLRFTVTE
jgi:uncharacterized repeat protein (TIGR02543 family)